MLVLFFAYTLKSSNIDIEIIFTIFLFLTPPQFLSFLKLLIFSFVSSAFLSFIFAHFPLDASCELCSNAYFLNNLSHSSVFLAPFTIKSFASSMLLCLHAYDSAEPYPPFALTSAPFCARSVAAAV